MWYAAASVKCIDVGQNVRRGMLPATGMLGDVTMAWRRVPRWKVLRRRERKTRV